MLILTHLSEVPVKVLSALEAFTNKSDLLVV